MIAGWELSNISFRRMKGAGVYLSQKTPQRRVKREISLRPHLTPDGVLNPAYFIIVKPFLYIHSLYLSVCLSLYLSFTIILSLRSFLSSIDST